MSPGDTGGDSPGGSGLKNLGGRLSAQQGGCREGCFPCFTSGFGVCGLNPNVRLAFPGASWSPCDCINTGTVYNGNSHDLQCQKETFPLLTQAVPLHWDIVGYSPRQEAGGLEGRCNAPRWSSRPWVSCLFLLFGAGQMPSCLGTLALCLVPPFSSTLFT